MIRTTSFIGLGMMLVLAACTPSTPLPSPSSSSSSSSALSQPSETAMLTYVNKTEGYRINYPNNWIVRERSTLNESFAEKPLEDVTGTTFLPVSEQSLDMSRTSVFTAITSTCVTFADQENVRGTTTIDGRTFQTVFVGDGAAGSVGEYRYYTSKLDASHCALIMSFTFHTTGEAYDEPIRTQVKQENAELNVLLDQIVHTFKLL